MDVVLQHGCCVASWMMCYSMDVVLQHGCCVASWMLCYRKDVVLHHGCCVTARMLCCIMDVALQHGRVTTWILGYSTDVTVNGFKEAVNSREVASLNLFFSFL